MVSYNQRLHFHICNHAYAAERRYEAVGYDTILNLATQWLRWNINKISNLQMVPHTWHSREGYAC